MVEKLLAKYPKNGSKARMVLRHLIAKEDGITQLEALQMFSSMRLAVITSRLSKKGWPIETNMIEVTNRIGDDMSRVARYIVSRDDLLELAKRTFRD